MAYTTINKPTDFFNTKLYTGNGSTQTISSVGFQPDFTWIKHRNGATAHFLFDVLRGPLYRLQSNSSNTSVSAADTLTSWNSDGFALGGENDTGGSGRTFASWNWKANGAGSANTAGSINSTVSVNTTSGFSICKWTGSGANATIGHGLGAVPKMIMIKNLGAGEVWAVYHKSLGATKFLRLNGTEAEQTNSTVFNNTEPTSSVFSVGGNDASNRNGYNMIAYCFAEKTGYSKFGSYVGNGNDGNGVFIYTGFKPSFVIIKKSSNAGEWLMLDNKRSTFNINQSKIFANDNAAENTDTSNGMDFLSNGIKLRRNNGESNEGGQSYIYMAFAAAPLVGTNGVTAKAR